MKKRIKVLIIGMLIAGITLFSFAHESLSGVVGTPHDLTIPTGGSQWIYDSDDPCVFCHTPHIGTGNPANTPLWNKEVPAGPFNMYTSASFDMGTASMSNPSNLCLSCHNGIGAMNVVYNTPGPGSTGAIDNPFGSFTMLGEVWYPGSPFGGVFKNIAENIPSGATPNNLKNDHPISFTYDSSLDGDDNGFPPRSVINGRGFIPGASGTLYPLYDFGTNRFECATCHSVHDTAAYNDKGLPGGQVFFLRRGNEGSALCLDCHTKR